MLHTYFTSFKLIKRSKVLTQQEKRKLFLQGITELVINSWKSILILPFYLIASIFGIIGEILEVIGDKMQNLVEIIGIPVQAINNLPGLYFKEKELLKKLKEEIQGTQTYKITEKDLKKA